MLCSAAWRLKWLKALSASTNINPSVVLSSNNPDIVCTAASTPLWEHPQVCIGPVTVCFSPLKFCINAAVTILLNILPIPTGRIPRFLSSTIILHDRKGRIGALSMFVLASLRVNLARTPHNSFHRFPKLSEQRIQFAPCAFKPLGPAPPLHFRATFLMYSPVSSAYRHSGTDSGVPFMRISGLAGSAAGCFFSAGW